jgi:chemotaxis signal transduction protein
MSGPRALDATRPARQLLPLSVGGAWLAIDAREVVEIIGPTLIVRLPGTPPLVPGVVAFRGRAVPVLDLGALRGVAAPLGPGASRARTVMVQRGPSLLALPADTVREVLEVSAAQIAAPAAGDPCAEGIIDVLGVDAPIVDLSRALPAFPARP